MSSRSLFILKSLTQGTKEMEYTFTVGKKEKHTVSFTVNRFFSIITIKVDGKQIRRSFFLFGGDKEFNLDIGDKEMHQIRIVLKIPIAMPAFKKWVYEVSVDGKHYQTYS